MAARRRDRRGRHLGQGRGAVVKRQTVGHGRAEIVAVERFRRRPVEKGCRRNRATCAAEASPAAANAAVDVGRGAGMAAHPIVDQRVAGAGVEGEDLSGLVGPLSTDPGHIGDAADVEDGDRLRQGCGEGGMVERRERCALAAGRDIGASGNRRPRRCRDAAPARRRRRAARCGARPGDAGSCGRGNRRCRRRVPGWRGEKPLDGLGVQPGQLGFDRGDRAGARPAPRAASRGNRRGRGSSAPGRRTTCARPSVSISRDIDPVERGAAHQPQRGAQICAR